MTNDSEKSRTTIIKATTDWVPKINHLVNAAYRGEFSKKGWTTEADLLGGQRIDEERIQEIIEDSHSNVFLLITQNHELLGCVHLKIEMESTYLGMLTIWPELQGKGHAKSLISYCEEWTKAHNVNTIRMTVITKRPELIEYYMRRGYFLSGKKEHFPTNDPRFGIPKVTGLEFVELIKLL